MGTDEKTLVKIRQLLVDEVEKSVVGPYFGDDEVLPSGISPTGTYWSGVLYPKEIPADPELNDDSIIISKDDGDGDNQSIPNIGLKPASFGLTCYVKSECKKLKIELNYGLYSKIIHTKKNRKSSRFGRQSITKTEVISLESGKGDVYLDDEKTFLLKYEIQKQKKIFVVTVFILNENISKKDEFKDIYRKCIFQPKIRLTSKTNEPVFVDFSNSIDKADTLDEDSMEINLLFSSKKNFASGHGCAIEWDAKDKSDTVSWLETTFLPKYEVPVIEPADKDLKGLFMKNLMDADPSEYPDLLNPIADEYENWINALDDQMSDVPDGFEKTASQQKLKCKHALSRIREGIKIVSEDKLVGEAFAFTNHAMYTQRAYGKWAERNKQNDGKIDGLRPSEDDFKKIRWRLFQLAFVLINIKSISDPTSDERKIADLLWFPTGGGKTEAYLGVIAFTMAYRRLRFNSGNDDSRKYGVTVIMRYTLRLLTLQQFQRAALLMCACEHKRRTEFIPNTQILKWGSEPFSVGLWVGTSTTPNQHDGPFGSIAAIKMIRHEHRSPSENNPMQLLSCPWCGAKLDGYCYHVSDKKDDGIRQCRISCSNTNCFFSSKKQDQGIPALVVDEDIYHRCPSLVIATVDKFAQISWKEKTGLLFGRADKYCPKHGFVISNFQKNGCNHRGDLAAWSLPSGKLEPPELIVQDELHLISGPLGTLTGIYETAIDYLCTNDDGIPPKIIASTATTKKSKEQIKGLFNREKSEIFPPQAFKFGDSFFAKERSLDDKPGKMYLGVCSTSRSGITVQAKIAASILRKIRFLKENLESHNLQLSDLDKFFTMTAYFNSMRELGNAEKMYEDSVPGFIDTIYGNFEKNTTNDESESSESESSESESSESESSESKTKQIPKREHRKESLKIKELTSRKRADEIPQILKDLDVKITSEDIPPTDLLICTNMLSVGVDISRLGAMIINGQPKNHAEYIQASGRVGRGFPGLIVTNYSYLKPRDLSHYENFNRYHSTFHMNVEPVSLTPFSSRARDRALFGIIVALVRLLETRLAKSKDAQFFDINQKWIKELVASIKEQIRKRVDGVDPIELDDTMTDFDYNIKKWSSLIAKGQPVVYSRNNHPDAKILDNTEYLMKSDYDHHELPIFVPNSLRDAESSVKLYYFDEEYSSKEDISNE